MKRFLSIFMVAIMLFSTIAMFACNKPDNSDPKEESTRMTIDINPSVEFMLDSENKVVSVTALNDDGAILIAGEALIGKTAEEATELVISIATETGYLSEGQDNNVSFSVSGDSTYAKDLANSIKTKIEGKLDELNLSGFVSEVEAATLEEIRTLVIESTTYTEEEVANMTEEQLYSALSLSRVETALLLTEELRNTYYQAKEHKISFAEREETARIIDEMGSIYALVNTAYKTALNAYQDMLVQIDEYRYDNLVSPDSTYQKHLASLRDAKINVLEKKNELASMDVHSADYQKELDALNTLEQIYTSQLEACEAWGEAVNEYVDGLLIQLRELEKALVSIEEDFSDDIKAELTAKAGEIEANVNKAKDNFFATFEEEHMSDIESIESSLLTKKEELKATINSDASNS